MLRRSVEEAQYLERQGRRLLSASRQAEAAAQKALAHQMRRMHRLEGLRLEDLQVGEGTRHRSTPGSLQAHGGLILLR